MAKQGDYNIGEIYQGGYDSFKPNYGDLFTGYHVPASSIGAPTKPDTANQIAEVNKLISQGMVPIEFSALSPEVFDTIPKQHFEEVRRMAKLTDTKISVHAPLIEPSGIGKEGWTEQSRAYAEQQLKDVVERSYELDHRGNMPIVIHSAGIPGTEWEIGPDGKKKIQKLMVINQETGQPAPLKEEIKYYPGKEKIEEEKWSPERQLENLNATEWDNAIDQILFQKERADEILQQNAPRIAHLQKAFQKGDITPETLSQYPEHMQAYNHVQNAEAYLQDVQTHLNALFSKAYKYGTDNQQKQLSGLNEAFRKQREEGPGGITSHSNAMQTLMLGLKNPKLAPQTYVKIEDFALKESSKTFGNVAFESFKKLGNDSPIISIENLYPGFAFSTGEEMNNLILASKKQFVENAMNSTSKGGLGMSRSSAEKQADRKIGLTFDVGHLNIHKKHGFKEEDLMKEFKEMSKHTTHVHLTDNFGHYDSHLPLGMGNVPIGKYMEILEKQGYKGRKIVEAGGWAQHFGVPSHAMTLEAMGSPVYQEGPGPYWNQSIGLQQGYSSGYGEMLPGIHYETLGAGFSQLPLEHGGQRGGEQGSRMSGRPME